MIPKKLFLVFFSLFCSISLFGGNYKVEHAFSGMTSIEDSSFVSINSSSNIKIEIGNSAFFDGVHLLLLTLETKSSNWITLAKALDTPNIPFITFPIDIVLSNGKVIKGKTHGLNSIKFYNFMGDDLYISMGGTPFVTFDISILSNSMEVNGSTEKEMDKNFWNLLRNHDIKQIRVRFNDELILTEEFSKIKTSEIIKQKTDYFIKDNSSPSYISSSTHSDPSTHNNYNKPRHRRSHGPFNAAKTEAFGGFVMGYVQKQWQQHADGESAKFGFWDGHRVVPGVRFGFCYNPQIKYGFGVNSGLNYEFYWSKTNDIEGYKGLMMEHVLSFPLHLEYRANFSKWFQLFVYGGFSFDCGVLGKMIIKDGSEEIYKNDNIYKSDDAPDWKRFNITADYGAGFRVNNLQITAGLSRGLLDMSSSSDYTIKQNRPLHLDLTIMF